LIAVSATKTAALETGNSATSHASDIARLRLIRSGNIGPVTFRQLIRRFGSAAAALAALPDLAQRGGGVAPRSATHDDVAREIDAVARQSGRLIFIGEAPHHALLEASEAAPPVLRVRGDLGLLDRGMVAMVGARNASAAACRFARGLASDLADADLVVVSGLARGIDAAAHWGALGGGTIGVVAGGIDVAYPPENSELQAKIAAQGLVVAEMPVGSPLGPCAQGCNALIRDGATLLQSAADVFEASDAEHRAIVGLLSPTAVAVDELVRQSGLATATAAGVLLDLELAGRLVRHADGRVAAT
jgi:DNA processing protein